MTFSDRGTVLLICMLGIYLAGLRHGQISCVHFQRPFTNSLCSRSDALARPLSILASAHLSTGSVRKHGDFRYGSQEIPKISFSIRHHLLILQPRSAAAMLRVGLSVLLTGNNLCIACALGRNAACTVKLAPR